MSDSAPGRELVALLSLLLAAERAGAKLLRAWLGELSRQSPFYERLRQERRCSECTTRTSPTSSAARS